MTTEPKFVPKEAADVKLSDDIEVKIRLADCVGSWWMGEWPY